MVSVIIPTYKPQQYFFRCIDSVLNQTLNKSKYEVIIILNGIRDPYYEHISNYISCFSNVKLIYSPISNVSNARNIGIKESKNEFISFIDDDDFISVYYLEELLKNANNNTVSLSNTFDYLESTKVFVDSRITREYKKNIDRNISDINSAKKFFSGPVYKLIHKDIISNFRFNTNFQNGEDSIFMFEISCNIRNIAFTDYNAVYYRRIRNNSATSRYRSRINKTKNSFLMIITYLSIYIKNPCKYSLIFLLTRIAGAIKQVVN